jgi:glycosyltransferase involved in cell wall biosynthesis
MVTELERIGFRPVQIRLIPSGVSVGKQLSPSEKTVKKVELGLDSHDIIVLFVGRLTWQKAPDVLIEAWNRVDHEGRSDKLLIVGRGDLERSLKAKTAELGLAQSVIFVPFTNNVERYYQIADVFVLPSRYEGFSSAMLDAMSHGLAVAVTRVSGTENIVIDRVNALLVNPDNVEQLSGIISSLLSDAQLRVSLGQKARQKVVEEYEMEVVGRKYVDLYNSLIGHTSDH